MGCCDAISPRYDAKIPDFDAISPRYDAKIPLLDAISPRVCKALARWFSYVSTALETHGSEELMGIGGALPSATFSDIFFAPEQSSQSSI